MLGRRACATLRISKQEAFMNIFNPTKAPARAAETAVAACGRACAAACCALALLLTVFGSAARAQVSAAGTPGQSGRVPPQLRQQAQPKPQPTPAAGDDDDDEDEADGESESVDRADAPPARPRAADPGTILRKARFVYVRSDTAFVSGQEVEASLQKRKEFKAWGMVVTRSEAQADLVIQITRRPLTRRFTFSVIDPSTMEVVASGKTRSVLFGKKISNKIAEKFANRVKVYRPYPPS
jgi:hypothetical protein